MAGTFKFDVVIGNPPYQEETRDTSDKPIYHLFMEEAYKIADRVSFITPARFLFDAGKTPKQWNEKMLGDEHLKVAFFEQDSSKVFSNTDIKGGVAVTYRDAHQVFGAIDIFIPHKELNSIFVKVKHKITKSIKTIIYSQNSYRYTAKLHEDYPEVQSILSMGHEYDVVTNAFDKLPFVFLDGKPNDGNCYIQMLGLTKNKRTFKWIRRDYIEKHPNLDKYKVFLPNSNGSGALGEVLSTPLIGEPLIGVTQTFISFGAFDTENEAIAAMKYIKSKFARTLLGVLKITQHNTAEKWKWVPLQDFTPQSDMDWEKSIGEIDRQLYRKYGLDEGEIAFIESHVQEMK